MAETTTMQIIIEAQNKTQAAFNDVQTKLGGLKGKVESMAPVFKGMAVAGGVAFAGIAAVIGKSIVAANEAAEVQAQLAAVLKSTHGVAGLYIEDLNDQAKALQKVSTFGDEAINSAQSLLLTFTNVKGPVFQQAIGTILDMSVALGQDLKSSSIQVGKALNDPIQGITALSRVGVSFTEQQKEQIKTLVESGKTMEAQKLILAELATEFGGSASAQAETFSGKMKQLHERVGDLQENIGNALLPVLAKLLEKVVPIIEKVIEWTNAHPELTGKILIVAAAVAGLVAVVGTLGLILPALITGLGALGTVLMFLAANPIGLTIVALGALVAIALKIRHDYGSLTEFFRQTWDGIKIIFKEAIDWIMAKIQPMLNAVQKVKDTAKSISGGGGLGFTNKIGDSISGALGIPGFANGGIVPGPTGSPQLAVVHGGERVLTADEANGGGSVLNFYFNGAVAGDEGIKQIISKTIATINRQATLRAVGGK